MKTKTLWIAVGIICTAAALWLIFRPTGKQTVTLETAKTERIDISNSVTATGTVEPVTKVEVGTQVSGIIDKLYADYNDIVKAGQVIAEMDKVNLQAELVSSQAQLSQPRRNSSTGRRNIIGPKPCTTKSWSVILNMIPRIINTKPQRMRTTRRKHLSPKLKETLAMPQ